MSSAFHAGERAVQERAGVRALADRVGGSIRDTMPDAARRFLEAARLVVIGAMDERGRPWASLVTGAPGVIRPEDARTVRLTRVLAASDPLAGALAPAALVGLLVPDLVARRRMRINGRVVSTDAESIVVRADQVFANCPKYIQRRDVSPEDRLRGGPVVTRGAALTARQRAWIAGADTFFIATANPSEGVDASHRGGAPGFLRVEGDTITWPDYPGNAMFNTLGNVAVYPRAGILVPDFTSGALLQLSGSASIEWGPSDTSDLPNPARSVRLAIEASVESSPDPAATLQ